MTAENVVTCGQISSLGVKYTVSPVHCTREHMPLLASPSLGQPPKVGTQSHVPPHSVLRLRLFLTLLSGDVDLFPIVSLIIESATANAQ